jgi:hypothetical protein
MSVAGGLHEMAHLARHTHSAAVATPAHTAADLTGTAIESGSAAQSSSPASDFCFFCTFGSSVTFSFATIDFEPGVVAIAVAPMPPAPDVPASPTTLLPSLRGPPAQA